MLKRFTLKNYKNFKDEITIDLKILQVISLIQIVFRMVLLEKC